MTSVLLAICLTAAAPPFEMKMLDGRTLVGSPTEITADSLRVDTPAGQVSLEIERLLSISAKRKTGRPEASDVVVELTDGSSIVGRQYTAREKLAQILLPNGETLSVPTDVVRAVTLRREAAPLAAEWSQLVNMKTDSDVLAVRNGESIDYHKGILHEISPELVRFELDGEVLPVKRSKIVGFAYHHAEAELPSAICRITDASGSQWPVRTLKLAGRFQWTTPAGLTVSLPADSIVRVDFSAGKIAYLSDLKPDSTRWTPYFNAGKRFDALERFHAPQYDRNIDSSPLRIGGEQFAKGLAVHSRTELAYRLETGRFTRFQATAAIEPAIHPGGRARLIVRGDDKTLADLPIAADDAPRPIDIDLSGVRRLTVIVDFGSPASSGDYLLLCDARLSK